ncbi:MinD/ParA family ATP-binding protein [Halorarum salinum]|uniref:CDP-4-keto-6-deoxy-D-glucose-3-dehydrase n=1 Tax=Halorarum salinum TaxID=2743089 RepID=A0A7D5QDV2_9EURY|nr:CDP-4-keto-6-deoxy-D-glucose-3-dehydrase [Halobaculum salinum]QLG62401.1 CDP-4-keto-6-deoxy-D-glucose-3-dehydrase [Halobaculum salinum]
MLAVTGGKGGSGKTTTTLGLARALDRPTVAVDADWDLPDLHALAGVPRPWPGNDAGEAVESAPDSDGTRVLPAPSNPRERDVGAVLRRLHVADPLVLADCPAGAGPDAAAPLRVADAALLAVTPCAPALRDAAKAAAMARELDTLVAGAVVTRATVVPPGVPEFLGCPVLARVPPVGRDVLSDRRVRAAYGTAAGALVEGSKL